MSATARRFSLLATYLLLVIPIGSLVVWYIIAIGGYNGGIENGINLTHDWMQLLINISCNIPGLGWATDQLQSWKDGLPTLFYVKNVADIPDLKLLHIWAVWAITSVVLFLAIVAASTILGWLLLPFRTSGGGAAAAAGGGAAAAAAGGPRAADNEWTERITSIKWIKAPLLWAFVVIPFTLSVTVPMVHNLFVDPDWTVWPAVVASGLWHGMTTAASATGKIFLLIVSLAVIAALAIGAMQAAIMTSRRNLPAGTPWRSVDTAYLASAFMVETVMLLGVLFFIIGL